MFGLATTLEMLFAARILAGILSSATLPTAQAYIADTTSPEDRAKGMGLIGAAFGLGFIFGPAVGGVLTQYGYGFPALVAAALSGLNFFWAVWKLPETKTNTAHESERKLISITAIREIFALPTLAILVGIFFVQIYAFSQMEATFALFSEHRLGLDAVHVGWILTEVGIISALIQGVMMGALVRRFGEVLLARTGLVIMAVGLIATGMVVTTMQMVIVVPLLAIGSALTSPTLNALISKAAPDDKQGLTMGTAQSLGALARVFGPPSGTGLFQLFGPSAPYYVGGVLMASIAWVKMGRHPKQQ